MEVSSARRPRSALARVFAVGAAFALYGVLVEALIEMWVFGSAVRWPATGLLVAYGGLSVVIWNRVDAGTKARLSILVLLLLLALSSWRLGSAGAEGGFAALRLSTTGMTAAATLAALGLATYVLTTSAFVGRAGRVATITFGLYCLLPFVVGMIGRQPFTAVVKDDTFLVWLPRWFKGGFLGTHVLIPLGIAAALYRLVRTSGDGATRIRQWGFVAAALALSFLLVVPDAMKSGSPAGVPRISDRGPGMRRGGATSIPLPVPRTFELSHVDPKPFAAGLGKDPARIFEFVRDQIAYEAYTGLLRGPRGTLMAMAGNSTDRAVLLGSLLEQAGHKVRYARGTLREGQARELVTSMWANRSLPAQAVAEPSPDTMASLKTLYTGVKRDYQLIYDRLTTMRGAPDREPTLSLTALTREAQAHYWVQWSRDGSWVDLDPSFADSTPGASYATPEEVFDTPPEALYHRVAVRIRLEEYSVLIQGTTEAPPSSREILSFAARASDLSGNDVLLIHQPENWKGPVGSLEAGVGSAIENTGRVKPVLIVGRKKWLAGDAFRQHLPTGRGVGGVGGILGGEGTRKPVPVGTAESIEIDLIAPGGERKMLTRDVFDVVGPARRAARKHLSSEEVRARTQVEGRADVSRNTYSVFFSTGRIDAQHLSGLTNDSASNSQVSSDAGLMLRRINIAFAATADALLSRVGRPGRAIVLFYPDAPRVQIAEVAFVSGRPRLAIDLRHSETRAVAIGPHQEDAFFGRILQGVVNGTLERAFVEDLLARTGMQAWGPVMSTSNVIEQAQAERVPLLFLSGGQTTGVARNVSDDALARMREDLGRGQALLVPERGIMVGSRSRLGWWRIDPRSGVTTAVTDEGLHQTGFEGMDVTVRRADAVGEEFVIVRLQEQETRFFVSRTGETLMRTDSPYYWDWIRHLLSHGANFPGGFPPPILPFAG